MEYFEENKKKLEVIKKYKFTIKYFNTLKSDYSYCSSQPKYLSEKNALKEANKTLNKLRKNDNNVGKARITIELKPIAKSDRIRILSKKQLKKNEIYVNRWGIIRNTKKYTIEEVLSKYDKDDKLVNFDGDLIPMGSQRYENFIINGTTCICCELKGLYFYKERFIGDNGYHFNLYGIRDDGREELFTKDHILPKSKGGPNHISNYQTLCGFCNGKKGSMNNDEFMKKYKCGSEYE